MDVEIRQGKYPGEWTIEFGTDEWTDAAREIHDGMEHGLAEIYSDAVGWFAPSASTPEQVLDIWNRSIAATQGRIDNGSPLIPELNDDATYNDARTALGDFLMLALWWYAAATDSLASNKLGAGARAFGRAMKLHGMFQALRANMLDELNEPPSGPAYALSRRSDQVLKQGWLAHCKEVMNSGREVSQLSDLLDVGGYDPKVTAIQSRTLKRWARSTGITFKPGRRKCA